MKTKTAKTCFDCLHCKVSAKKIRNTFRYFCAMSKNKTRKQEAYWLEYKKLCKKFVDMDDEEPRRPLLRNRGLQ